MHDAVGLTNLMGEDGLPTGASDGELARWALQASTDIKAGTVRCVLCGAYVDLIGFLCVPSVLSVLVRVGCGVDGVERLWGGWCCCLCGGIVCMYVVSVGAATAAAAAAIRAPPCTQNPETKQPHETQQPNRPHPPTPL